MSLAYRGSISEIVRFATAEDITRITRRKPTAHDLAGIRYHDLVVVRYDDGRMAVVDHARILASGGPVEVYAALQAIHARNAAAAREASR